MFIYIGYIIFALQIMLYQWIYKVINKNIKLLYCFNDYSYIVDDYNVYVLRTLYYVLYKLYLD